VGVGCERFTRDGVFRSDPLAPSGWRSLSRTRLSDWDSAKSLKSTRGCRSVAGAGDKWGNGQLAESFPPFTSGTSPLSSRGARWELQVLVPGNYKLFVISRRDFAGSSGATRSLSLSKEENKSDFLWRGLRGLRAWPFAPTRSLDAFCLGRGTSELFHELRGLAICNFCQLAPHATAFFIYLRSTFNSLYSSILCTLFSYLQYHAVIRKRMKKMFR